MRPQIQLVIGGIPYMWACMQQVVWYIVFPCSTWLHMAMAFPLDLEAFLISSVWWILECVPVCSFCSALLVFPNCDKLFNFRTI